MDNHLNKGKIILPLDLEGITPFPGRIIADPFGSYTGIVSDPEEKPVQDADDL